MAIYIVQWEDTLDAATVLDAFESYGAPYAVHGTGNTLTLHGMGRSLLEIKRIGYHLKRFNLKSYRVMVIHNDALLYSFTLEDGLWVSTKETLSMSEVMDRCCEVKLTRG